MPLIYSEIPLSYEPHEFEDEALLRAQDLRDIDEGVYAVINRANSQGQTLTDSVQELENLRVYATQGLTELSRSMTNYTDELTNLEDSINLFLNGSDQSEQSCNRLITPGSYAINGSFLGSPLSNTSDTGFIFVFGHVDTEHPLNTVLCQLCVEGSGSGVHGNVYTRHYANYEFSEWTKALVDADVTNTVTNLESQYSALLSRVEALEAAMSNPEAGE